MYLISKEMEPLKRQILDLSIQVADLEIELETVNERIKEL